MTEELYPGFDVIEMGIPTTVEQTDPQEKQVEGQTTQEEPNFIDSYFELLKSEGLIEVADDFKFDGKIETFKQVQQDYYTNLKQRAAEEILSSVPEKNRLLVEAALNGEVDIENVLNAVKNQPLSVPKSESEKLIIIEKDLKGKGVAEEEIEILIESYKKSKKVDSVVERIVESSNKLIKEKVKQEEEAKVAARKAAEEQIAAFSENTKAHLEKTSWNPEKKKEVFDMIFTPTEKGVSKTVEILNDIFEKPETLLTLAHFLSYYKDGKLDIDTYKNIKTKNVDQVKSDWEKLFSKPAPNTKDATVKVDVDMENVTF